MGTVVAPLIAPVTSSLIPTVSTISIAFSTGVRMCISGQCGKGLDTAKQIMKGVWNSKPFNRGLIIEQAMGKSSRLPQNMPVIDVWRRGVATSILSIDLTAKSYQNLTRLTWQLKKYVTILADWEGGRWGKARIDESEILIKNLLLAIPPSGSESQKATINNIINYASQQGVNLITKIFY